MDHDVCPSVSVFDCRCFVLIPFWLFRLDGVLNEDYAGVVVPWLYGYAVLCYHEALQTQMQLLYMYSTF